MESKVNTTWSIFNERKDKNLHWTFIIENDTYNISLGMGLNSYVLEPVMYDSNNPDHSYVENEQKMYFRYQEEDKKVLPLIIHRHEDPPNYSLEYFPGQTGKMTGKK